MNGKDFAQQLALARQGNARSQFMLAETYSSGQLQWWQDPFVTNDSQAFLWYKKAAEQNHKEAQYALGKLYDSGRGVARNAKATVVWYLQAAKQGHQEAQYAVGECYASGRGVAKDDEAAVRWYQKAAEQGHEEALTKLRVLADSHKNTAAQYALGVCYATGRGVAKNEKEAVSWYQQAAEEGHKDAQYALGESYASGQGGYQDLNKAIAWYQKAAEQGHEEALTKLRVLADSHKNAAAQYALGESYASGQGGYQDLNKAIAWYQKAAEQGHEEALTKLRVLADSHKNTAAQYALGVCYATGRGITQDLNKAIARYQKAGEQGHKEALNKLRVLADSHKNAAAQYALGECYASGRGVAKDDQVAVFGYQKAAEQGHEEALTKLRVLADSHKNTAAQYALGVCYATGRGVARNEKEAARWYQMAATQHHQEAQYAVGECYASGRGVAKDDEAAVRWYQKAAEQGHEEALNKLRVLADSHKNTAVQYALGELYVSGRRGVTQDINEGIAWYQKAAEQNHSESLKSLKSLANAHNATAQCALGELYVFNQGVQNNYSEAMVWYDSAAKQGYLEAPKGFKLLVEQGYTDAWKKLIELASNGDSFPKYDQERDSDSDNDDYSGSSVGSGSGGSIADSMEGWLGWGLGFRDKGKNASPVDHRYDFQKMYALAQYSVAEIYAIGKSVSRNIIEAVFWYTRAAKGGYSSAVRELINLANDGSFIAQYNAIELADLNKRFWKDSSKAEELFKNDNSNVQQLGNLDTRFRKDNAFTWYQKAAEQGVTEAWSKIGSMYSTGKGVIKDEVKAVEWYERAVEQSDVQALKDLRKLSKTGSSLASIALGNIYAGRGEVAQNDAEAVKWYKKAARQGYVEAFEKLGSLAQDGCSLRLILEDDLLETLENEHTPAIVSKFDGTFDLIINNKGFINRIPVYGIKLEVVRALFKANRGKENIFLEKNSEIIKWITLEGGNDPALARRALGNIYGGMWHREKEKARANEYCLKAAEQGHVIAIKSLKRLLGKNR